VERGLSVAPDGLRSWFLDAPSTMLQWPIGMRTKRGFVTRVTSAMRHAGRAAGPFVRFQVAYRTVPLLALWVLLVLYPNPFNLLVSVHRVFNLDVDPVAVGPLLDGLPSEPFEIEKEILRRIPYKYDWETSGMPWYFPRTASIVERREGDCKARAVVLASVFERLEIPYRINSSFVHVWVDYADKPETVFENPRARFYEQDPETGKRLFQLPEIEWRLWFDSTVEGLWTVMPLFRKVLLIMGTLLIVVGRILLRRNTNQSIDNATAT